MQARYYDPVIGRFYSNDPVGWTPKNPVMSFNRYLYVNNNPYKYNDPNGEFLNFAVKFVADVALGAALNYAETGSLNLGGAVTDAAVGALNPAKTLQKAKRLANVMKGGGKNSPCPLSCFVAGTQVLTKDGHKPIENISVGDLVWAKNVETGLSEWKPVTHTWIVEDKEIYEIGFITLDGNYQTIEATSNHPFYVSGKGWVDTIDLNLGDIFVDNLGKPIVVELLRKSNRKDIAYNFTVADFHTYYVTQESILVHNCGGSRARRNGHLAGQNHPKTGIPFDSKGYPDFSSVSKKDVQIEFSGNRRTDTKLANQAAGLDKTPEGMVWHHHQDGKTMQLVPREIHSKTGHDGGFAGN